MLTKGLFTSSTDNWSTPQSLFDELNKTFHFTLDVCADERNHKCERYFTKADDGLKQNWGGGHYLVQPTLWQGDWQMGREMLTTYRSGGYASASSHRHQMVANLHLQEPMCFSAFRERQIKVQRWQKPCAIPKRHCGIHQHQIGVLVNG